MPIFLKNSVFIHVPKTGGVWVKRSLERSTLITKNHTLRTGHFTPDIKDKGVFLFVREPSSWLGSFFSQRKFKGWNWQDGIELEEECRSDNFNEFIDNVCEREGIVERYFDQYTKKYEKNNNLRVGKQENLSGDLIGILRYFDEEFEEKKIKKLSSRKQNISKKKFGFRFEASGEQKKKIYSSQKGFYKKYGYKTPK